MFYNMTVLFLLMCQIPARTRCIFVFRDFECIGGGVNDTVAAVGGTAQGVDVKALFFFHLPYHVRRCTEKVFLGVAVGKDGDVGHFLVFYRYLHFDIPAEVPFVSPDSMKVTMKLPYKGVLTGMGIRKGITLVVGGGYHGKSTLLKALESGVYPHIAGDGREYVVTDDTAMKIRAEDGRSIRHTDISMFINDLPNGKDTYAFDTEDASGSTSQAANVIESMEAGTQVFLIDEDTSATNFMVRDELMQQVIHRDMEPITPFIERVRDLYQEDGISTVLVAGSSGAYFQIADQIIQMDKYVPREITELAKKAASDYPALKFPEAA